MEKELNLRTRPEPHNTQFLEAMAAYRFAGQAVTGGRVLDAACAYGYGAGYLAERAESVVGVDLDPAVLSWGRRQYRARNLAFAAADLRNLSFKSGAFDAVCLFEAIHIVDAYEAVLEEARRVLKPGGMLCISTRRAAGSHRDLDAAHLHQFTVKTMTDALRRCGFDVCDVYGIDRPGEVYALEEKLAALRRFDLAGFKRFIPRPLVSWAVSVVAKCAGMRPPQELGADAFPITKESAGTAPGILIVCKKVA